MVNVWRIRDEIIRNRATGTKLKSKEVVVTYVKCKYENSRKVWIGCIWNKETFCGRDVSFERAKMVI